MKIINQTSLINLFEKEFPLNTQEKWDFSGFSFKAKIEKPLKILVCLDVDKNIILRAIRENISLIVSHHPFCFASSLEEAINLDKSKGNLIDLLNENNISAYSLHTTFDSNIKGTDYFLLKKLGFLNKITNKYKFSSIVQYNSSFQSLTNLLKNKLSLNFVISNWLKDVKEIVNKIYFAPGAGDIYEYINHSNKDKCDLIVTSDIKWNEQVVLQNLGLNFIIVSHKIEEVFVDGISEFMKNNISNDVEVILDYKKETIKSY